MHRPFRPRARRSWLAAGGARRSGAEGAGWGQRGSRTGGPREIPPSDARRMVTVLTVSPSSRRARSALTTCRPRSDLRSLASHCRHLLPPRPAVAPWARRPGDSTPRPTPPRGRDSRAESLPCPRPPWERNRVSVTPLPRREPARRSWHGSSLSRESHRPDLTPAPRPLQPPPSLSTGPTVPLTVIIREPAGPRQRWRRKGSTVGSGGPCAWTGFSHIRNSVSTLCLGPAKREPGEGIRLPFHMNLVRNS